MPFQPFHELLPEQAAEETRSITLEGMEERTTGPLETKSKAATSSKSNAVGPHAKRGTGDECKIPG